MLSQSNPVEASRSAAERLCVLLASPALWLIGLAILAYWPVSECGFIWDDDDYLTDNRLIQ